VRFTDAGMLGFAELNPGRAGYVLLWHGQGTLFGLADDHADIEPAGGTAWEEIDWEDGLEAPPRPTLRHSQQEWQREPQPLPAPELMEAWSLSGEETLVGVDRMMAELRIRERERAEEEERRRFARAKAQAVKRRRERELAVAREQRHNRERLRQLPPPAPERRQRFVTPEQLAAFLGLPSAP